MKNLNEFEKNFLYFDEEYHSYKTYNELLECFDIEEDYDEHIVRLFQKTNHHVNMFCKDIFIIMLDRWHDFCKAQFRYDYNIHIYINFDIDINKVSLKIKDKGLRFCYQFQELNHQSKCLISDIYVDDNNNKFDKIKKGYFYVINSINQSKGVYIYPKNVILSYYYYKDKWEESDKRNKPINFNQTRFKDKINPDYYKNLPIEIIDCIKSILTNEPNAFKGYLKGNIIKYISRENKKNGKEDLEKARWYLNKLINGYKEEHND